MPSLGDVCRGRAKGAARWTSSFAVVQAHEHAVATLMSLMSAVTAEPATVTVTTPLPFANDTRPILPDQGTADADDAVRTADGALSVRTGAHAAASKPYNSASGVGKSHRTGEHTKAWLI